MEAIKTVPYVPRSHPFVERLIGTIRRECLDRTLFWTAADLEAKLFNVRCYFNGHRTHAGLGRADAGTAHRRGQRASECQYVSLAAPLSWAVSDADRGMTVSTTPAQRQVGTSRGVDRMDATRALVPD